MEKPSPAAPEQPDVTRRRVLRAIAGSAIASPGIANAVSRWTGATDTGAARRESLEARDQPEAPDQPQAQDQPDYYPPTRQGMRGSHPGSFEAAHALRDGTLKIEDATRVDDTYDLVVVGGGISGLSAAYFYRAAKPAARILILENHDDFGGHAKRNEIEVDGHTLLMNGGTYLIDSPRPYSGVSRKLLEALDIRPSVLAKRYHEAPALTGAKLGRGVLFAREFYGRDVLISVPGGEQGYRSQGGDPTQWANALREAPISDASKQDIVRVETGVIDYFPALTAAQTMDRLSRISYRDYLKDVVQVAPQVLDYYQASTHGEFGVGIDAEPALDCWGIGLSGFLGLKLDHRITARMGNTAAGYSSTGGSASFHFPDGNATVARALVRKLVTGVAPPGPIEGLVSARFDYGQLDRSGKPVRIRLNSTVLNVKRRSDELVDIRYRQSGEFNRVSGRHCILAGYNMMIPFLLPELPEAQKAALHQLVKIPLVYTTVALRNWRAFKALGISGASCPGGYFSSFHLLPGPDIGKFSGPRSPEDPIVVLMLRTPCLPGAPTERDQHRAGRTELLETDLEVFESHVRDQLGRALKPGGFDADRDIAAIIVNRWPHGYAYEYNPLYDPWDVPERSRPHVIGRQRFGPIAIANSDSGAAAYTDSAIDQAYRAVSELIGA
jgi:spermidine dehydrogenase